MATKVKFVNQNPTQSLIYFNPRSRKGSDHLPMLTKTQRVISIYAPVKGATISAFVNAGWEIKISIHAPVKGAT